MTAKEYLSQAKYIDNRIASKREQIQNLNDLATKCTSTWSDMPGSTNQGGSRMADCVMKIIDLEEQISEEMVKLIELKKEIADTINTIENDEYKTLLEKRYLCWMTWEKIAVDMNYSAQHIHRLHGNALRLKYQNKEDGLNGTTTLSILKIVVLPSFRRRKL